MLKVRIIDDDQPCISRPNRSARSNNASGDGSQQRADRHDDLLQPIGPISTAQEALWARTLLEPLIGYPTFSWTLLSADCNGDFYPPRPVGATFMILER
jgi:hypothetical protein